METLSIESIVIDANVRRHMNPDKLKELTENIKKVGVLEPVLIRHDEGKYILIAGHRRLAAAKAAKLAEIPVRQLFVTATEAQEIQALENLHREDLGPVDEARSFKALLDLGSHTVESLAARVDKSTTYVYRSIRLLELPEKILTALEDGRLTTGHAQQILRAPIGRWDALVKYATTKDWHNRLPTVDDLKGEIDRTIAKRLDKAPFPTNVEYAGAVACTACPFNSGNQGMLFDGAQKGQCLNPVCYASKTKAYDKDLRVQGEKKYPGIEFVGSAVDRGWGDRAIGKGLVIKTMTPALKAAMKKTPEKFGFGLLRPDIYQGGKPQITLVCTDPALLGIKPEQEASPRLSKEEQGRINFIGNEVRIAMYKALILKMKVSKEDLVETVSWAFYNSYDFDSQALLAAVGIEDGKRDDNKSLEKLDEETLRKLIVIVRLSSDEIEQTLKRSGVKPSEIRKPVEKLAAEAWVKSQGLPKGDH